jgi:hypothetical protein
MTSSEIEKGALQLVRNHWKDANVSNVYINERIPHFFRGALYIVSIIDAVNEKRENNVYVVGKKLLRYDDLRDLGAHVGRSSLLETLQGIFHISVITGVIAMIITATICYRFVSQPHPEIPELLGHSLTLILGFYFGQAVVRGRAAE